MLSTSHMKQQKPHMLQGSVIIDNQSCSVCSATMQH